jgi:hypothetical protein
MWTMVPAQAVVGQWLATFKEFLPSQESASFSIDQVLQQLQTPATAGGNLRDVPEPRNRHRRSRSVRPSLVRRPARRRCLKAQATSNLAALNVRYGSFADIAEVIRDVR